MCSVAFAVDCLYPYSMTWSNAYTPSLSRSLWPLRCARLAESIDFLAWDTTTHVGYHHDVHL